MPANHPAAERAYQKYEGCFDVLEEAFVDPDLPAIITDEYTPFVEAARKLCRRSTVDTEQPTQTFVFTADLETLRAVLRDTVGEL